MDELGGRPMNHLAPVIASLAVALVAAAGTRASYRLLEFFTAQIRNPHTRHAHDAGRPPLQARR
jgi:hypothetical protein